MDSPEPRTWALDGMRDRSERGTGWKPVLWRGAESSLKGIGLTTRITEMIRAILTLALVCSSWSHAAADGDRIEYDFNFDGHIDYCVCTLDNARGSEFDVFIFDPRSSKHVRNEVLSGTVYPMPDPTTEEVRCIWAGGHGGALYSGSVYRWTGSNFEFAYSERQEAVMIDGEICYIRVKATILDGKPAIISIERIEPHSEDSEQDAADEEPARRESKP